MKLAVAALVSCVIAPDKQVPVKAGPGRAISCGLDLGSRSAKLSVVSMEKGRPKTIREERICKRTLGMGALVFDSKTGGSAVQPPAYLRGLGPSDFKALRSEPVRGMYGQKALVTPALAELLIRELGASGVVTVPQEVTTGHILQSLASAGR